jgi:hypothetical protein
MINLISKFNVIILDQNDKAEKFAKLYIDNRIIPEIYRMYAFHIPIATINGLDKIISLNLKHIIKDKTILFTRYINTIY